MITIVGVTAFRGPVQLQTIQAGDWLGYTFLGFLTVTAILCFMAILPRYPSAERRNAMCERDRWSWPSLTSTKLSPDEYSEYIQTSEVSQLLHSVAITNSFSAEFILKKFRFLKFAFVSAILALVMLVVREVVLGSI